MQVHLLYKDRIFDPKQPLPWNVQDLVQDLELETLFKAMSLGNDYLLEVVKCVVLTGMNNTLETIFYRQAILKDCLKNPLVVKQIYDLAVETIDKEKNNYWGIFSKYPDSILYRSVEVLQMFVVALKKLRAIADEHAGKFNSEGFSKLFVLLKTELNDAYFADMESHLEELKFRDGHLMSAQLGKGNKGTNYMLRKFPARQMGWFKRFILDHVWPELEDSQWLWAKRFFGESASGYTFYISSRDEGGIRALRELRDEGINLVANALAKSDEHILGFFKSLKAELAFYSGCLNLNEQLENFGEPISFPEAFNSGSRVHQFEGLYDVCLALNTRKKVVGNDVNADSKDLIMITGANQGGKSTFLRSVGLAQLMLQCGMFVPATSFRASISSALYTHFKREEDSGMKSGKLDEELDRMDQIINRIVPGSLLLFNESFAATNEREGSEIARQIVNALLGKGFKVIYVTHLYEFAFSFYDKKMNNAIFLRADRQPDGSRSFRLTESEPLQTSYGGDLYKEIFANGQYN
jgi:DNA mismatch repair ATPase MutS